MKKTKLNQKGNMTLNRRDRHWLKRKGIKSSECSTVGIDGGPWLTDYLSRNPKLVNDSRPGKIYD